MSSMEEVEKAAKYLDGLVGKVDWIPANWRTLVDTDTLDMMNVKKCVLGQIQGNYSVAADRLNAQFDDWHAVQRTFCTYGPWWIEYLNRTGGPIDESAKWVSKAGSSCNPTAVKNIRLDGTDMVAFKINNSINGSLYSVENFLKYYEIKPEPRFKVGDLLWFGKDDEPHYLVREIDEEGYALLIRIGAQSDLRGVLGTCSLVFAERSGVLTVKHHNPFKNMLKDS